MRVSTGILIQTEVQDPTVCDDSLLEPTTGSTEKMFLFSMLSDPTRTDHVSITTD
jgi:hypothetical protein